MMSELSAIAMLADGIDGVSVGKHASTRESFRGFVASMKQLVPKKLGMRENLLLFS